MLLGGCFADLLLGHLTAFLGCHGDAAAAFRVDHPLNAEHLPPGSTETLCSSSSFPFPSPCPEWSMGFSLRPMKGMHVKPPAEAAGEVAV